MNDIIEKIKKDQGIFSLMKVEGTFDLDFFKKRKNLILIKSISRFDKTIIYDECFFKTTAGFYLYLKKNPLSDAFFLSIFHKEEHINEIMIFLNQLIKK